MCNCAMRHGLRHRRCDCCAAVCRRPLQTPELHSIRMNTHTWRMHALSPWNGNAEAGCQECGAKKPGRANDQRPTTYTSRRIHVSCMHATQQQMHTSPQDGAPSVSQIAELHAILYLNVEIWLTLLKVRLLVAAAWRNSPITIIVVLSQILTVGMRNVRSR